MIHYIGTSEFRIVTCLLQSSTLNGVTICLLIIVPIFFFFIAVQIHFGFTVTCLMLLSVAFIVRRIRVLVYSERNQLSKSIIALLFKQCLGSLKQKKKKKLFMYLWIPFILHSIVFFIKWQQSRRKHLLTFLLTLI